MKAFDRLAVFPNFAHPATFEILKKSALRKLPTERITIPWHKRGGTVAYGSIRLVCPEIARFYESSALAGKVADIVGESLAQTPLHDQSSCSLLIYSQAGDRIGWHFDHNFYNGRHFTALLPLVNEREGEPGLSSAQLLVNFDDRQICVPTPPNTLVLFEGARLRHCVTPQGPGERRVILSMTFCADSGTTRVKDLQRRFKDIAYIGTRALWT